MSSSLQSLEKKGNLDRRRAKKPGLVVGFGEMELSGWRTEGQLVPKDIREGSSKFQE